MSASPVGVTAEIHGFSEPEAIPTPWALGLQAVVAADTFWLSTVRPDGRPGRPAARDTADRGVA